MRRIAASIASLVVIASVSLGAVAVAQGQDRDPIEVERPTVETVPQSSGYTDDQGNPISIEEFNRIREEETGVQWGNIAIVAAVLVLVAGAIVVLVRRRRLRGG